MSVKNHTLKRLKIHTHKRNSQAFNNAVKPKKFKNIRKNQPQMQHNRPTVVDDTNVFVKVIHPYNLISADITVSNI